MSTRGWTTLAVLLVLALTFPFISEPYTLVIASAALLSAAQGLSWNLLGGYAGQMSLGHGIYFGIGAYTSSILLVKLQISPYIGMFAGALLAMLVAAGIGVLGMRLKGPMYVMLTIGLLKVFETLALKLETLTNGAVGLTVSDPHGNWANFQFTSYHPYYLAGLLLVGAVLLFTLVINKRKTGYYLRALRENEDAAQAIGVHTLRYKVWAAAWSGFFTALAGTLYAQMTGMVEPGVVFGFEVSLQMMLVAYIGGTDSPFGPVVGALLLTPLAEYLRAKYGMVPGLNLFIYGIALIVVMLWLRQGIVPAVVQAWKRWTARKGKEEGQRRVTA